jgi:catechol 2,3-dioxygenase-like lactoylglutathione lyase family enzyme
MPRFPNLVLLCHLHLHARLLPRKPSGVFKLPVWQMQPGRKRMALARVTQKRKNVARWMYWLAVRPRSRAAPCNITEKAMTSSGNADMKLEVVVFPVSDVDRAKRFYADLGWRLDADFAGGDWRVIQFTPPGSPTSVIFGKNVAAAVPGSTQGLYLIVSDIEAARADLVRRGVEVSETFHGGGDEHGGPDEPYIFGRLRVSGPIPNAPATAHWPRSAIQTAMAGCSRKSRRPARTRRCRHHVHLFGRTVEGAAACGGRAWRA